MDSDERLDKLDERIRGTENALASLTAGITLSTNNIKENANQCRTDLSSRMDSLHNDMKENHTDVTDSVDALNASLQKLYVSHSGAQNTVKFNEKLVWGIVTVILTVGLYLIQDFIKVAGGA